MVPYQHLLRGSGAAKRPRVLNSKHGYLRFMGAPAGRHLLVKGLESNEPEEIAGRIVRYRGSILANAEQMRGGPRPFLVMLDGQE